MPIMPKGVAYPEQLAAAVTQIEEALRPDVVRIRHTIENDSSGEPAIFIRVLLSDAASRPDRLLDVTSRIRAFIYGQIDPFNSWGLVPYIHFRSESEQAVLRERAWS
jgi:hypothetical protein